MASGVCAMARKCTSAEDVAVPQVYVGRWRSEGGVLCVTIGANGRWVLESKELLADGSISYYSEAIRGDAMHGWKEPPEPSLVHWRSMLCFSGRHTLAVAGNGITVDGVLLHRDETFSFYNIKKTMQLMENTSEQDMTMTDQEEEDRLYLEQERKLVLEHNRRVREAQRRVREARRPWREEQAQVWFQLNQRYERMLEHDRRVREAQAQRLRREEQAKL